MIDPRDPEIRAFVAASGAESFSAMAAECARRFGADRAWPADVVAATWRELNPPRRARRSRFEGAPEVVSFIADHADLLTLDALRALLSNRFGAADVPSRSQLFRIVQKIRARQKAVQRALSVGAPDLAERPLRGS